MHGLCVLFTCTFSELKRNVLNLLKLHTRSVWVYDNQPSHTIYSPRLIEAECWLPVQFPYYEENEAIRTVCGHPRSPQRSHSEEPFLEVDTAFQKITPSLFSVDGRFDVSCSSVRRLE